MSISFNRYVRINSGVGAGAQAQGREFNGRFYTINPLLPTGNTSEFDSLDLVGDYFGTSSGEYKRAAFYFGFVSKNITRPQEISFSRWVDADTQAMIFGSRFTASLSDLNLITNGVFGLRIGGNLSVPVNIGPINFSAAASLAAIATLIETAINAIANPEFATATVTYDSIRGSFDFVSGVAQASTIAVSAGTGGTDIMNTIGWGADAIFSGGAVTESITDTLTNSASASDNFGSYNFIPSLTIDQLEESSIWNDGQNVKYMFSVKATNTTDATAYYNALKNYGGTTVTYNSVDDEYSEIMPMVVFASTNYDRPNSVQNYMFQQASLTPSVTTDVLANQLDAIRTNYYGQTQTAGRDISFYQRGLMFGLPVDPKDLNTYANEIWLKDAAGVSIMNLLLGLSKVSANLRGVGQILATLQPVIDQAILNGTISQGKPLTQLQKIYITELTNDPEAWYQVQGIGYWIDCNISQNNDAEFQANYLLVYGKDDVIRFVEGAHVLI